MKMSKFSERERRGIKEDTSVGKTVGCQTEVGNGDSRDKREITGDEAPWRSR